MYKGRKKMKHRKQKNSTHFYLLLGSFFLCLFIFLSAIVYFSPESLSGFDSTLTSWSRIFYPHLNTFFKWYTKLANSSVFGVLAIVFAIILAKFKYYAEALWLLINTALIAGVVNTLIKLFISRERPALNHLVTSHNSSYPSGHSIGSILLYGTLVVLMPLFIKNKKVCRLVQYIISIGIFLIGVSRVYTGVHFPSDILGGFLLGLAWLFLSYPVYLNYRFSLPFKQKRKHG